MVKLDMNSVYLETTIPSYLTAKQSKDPAAKVHQQLTKKWWKESRQRYSIYISELVMDELSKGNPEYARKRMNLVAEYPILDLTDEIAELGMTYLNKLNLPDKANVDALHIAFAVEYKIDYLLTWNCAHIDNGAVKMKLQEYNMKHDLHLPIIVTPEELMPMDA